MKKYTEHCDLCKKEFKHRWSKNGFCAVIGYSLGGWGFRRDFVNDISIVVCDDCFSRLKQKSKELNDLLKKLKC